MSIVPFAHGVRVVCNRDERRSRPEALAPRAHALGDRTALFPVDPVSGGTWIGVNDVGLAGVLLNRTPVTGSSCLRPGQQSRGTIVPALLAHSTLAEAATEALALDPRRYEPFSLIAVENARAVVVTSNGDALAATTVCIDQPLMFTSSSLGDVYVETPRRDLFERMVVGASDGWRRGQSRFHRHGWLHHPAISVVMERPEARTVSRTVLNVAPNRIWMRYTQLAGRQHRDRPSLAGAA